MENDMRYKDVHFRLQTADIRAAVPQYENQFKDIDRRIIQCDVLSHSIQNTTKDFVQRCSQLDNKQLGQSLSELMQENNFARLDSILQSSDDPDTKQLRVILTRLQKDYVQMLEHWNIISKTSKDMYDSIKRLVH